ncbi:MAG: LysM peptidoglycan-binding domain-containing protein [Anaerolineae bacterium]|nr:LysM peptidoglycan-binding domain-containing protein [Anaerolineae bacterium]
MNLKLFAILTCVMLLTGCALALESTVYTIQPGDTLAKIARANGTTVGELVELNKASYPSLETNPAAIEVGWKIEMPGGSSGDIRVTIKTPSAGPTTVPLDRDAFEMEVLRLVNEERTKAGLAPLEVDPGLMQFARERSEDMVARNYISHYDPQTNEKLYSKTLREYGYGGHIAENATKLLATTSVSDKSAKRAVSNWMRSEGHRKNISSSQDHKTGVGIAVGSNYIIVTQLFAE